jgi:hypothetical protein
MPRDGSSSSRILSDPSNISLNALNRSYFNMAHVEERGYFRRPTSWSVGRAIARDRDRARRGEFGARERGAR